MTSRTRTFRHALECAGWGYPKMTAHCGAAIQWIVRNKQVGRTFYWPDPPDILDSPTGYDYVRKGEWRVFAWDEDFFYLQANDVDGTEFIQVPKRSRAYMSEPIVVVDYEEDK